MTGSLEERLAAALASWVRCVGRRPRGVAAGLLALTAALVPWTALHLGITSDNLRLLAPELPFLERHRALLDEFPVELDPLFVLVEGPDAGRTRAAAEQLAERLRADAAHVRSVFLAGSGAFFERYGLLYRSVEELEEFIDALVRAQPLVAALERDPQLATLVSVLERSLDRGDAAGDPEIALFDALRDAIVRSADGSPVSTSLADLLLAGSRFEPGLRQVLVVDPVLDYASAFSAREPLRAIRGAAATLPGAGELRVRITGEPALNYEEMRGLVWDVGVTSLASFAMVVALLFVALRSLRLVAAAAASVLVGLVWTSAFAAAAIGTLNLVSVTFAVLFIGLGIDFSIHLLLHYVELRGGGATSDAAIEAATRRVGVSLALCAVTTALGFYAFVPTDYLGMAELGSIAGTGMLVILCLTLTLVPALLGCGLAPARLPAARPERRVPSAIRRLRLRPAPVCLAFAALGLASGAALPSLRFDFDIVQMRNPDTESVRAFEALAEAGGATSPWSADVVAPDLGAADALAERLRRLEPVAEARTLSDLVPEDQDEKLDLLADADFLLAAAPASADTGDPSGAPCEASDALRRLAKLLERHEPAAPPRVAASMRALRAAVERFLAAAGSGRGEHSARELERQLFGELDAQLGRLRRALDPGPLGRDDLPDELVRRVLAPSGRARVEVFPREGLDRPEVLAGFVDAVLAAAPNATGNAVNLIEFGRATASALREALLAAFVAIALLLSALWRRPSDVACVLAPLVLGSLLTAGTMALVGMSFNFANAIVLPLLLGVGVDSGIHVVQGWRGGASEGIDQSTPRRAVCYSALTTVASFGNLGLSGHRGIASMGLLLTIAMGLSLACNLVFLPALLELRRASPPHPTWRRWRRP